MKKLATIALFVLVVGRAGLGCSDDCDPTQTNDPAPIPAETSDQKFPDAGED
jgi:hypothetical protein